MIAFLGAAPVVYQAIVGTPWRLRRMLAFLDPWQYRYDVGYQITESLISIGSGGMSGLGLGDGKQKLFFLPEAHTDYIMAIVGEELGLIGICAVAALLRACWCGAARARRCARATPSAATSASASPRCSGCRRWSTSAWCSARCRPRGCRCRSSSFGGSTLVVDLFAMGILLNISRGGAGAGAACAAERVAAARPLGARKQGATAAAAAAAASHASRRRRQVAR